MFDPNKPETALIDPRPRDRWGRFITDKSPGATAALDLGEEVQVADDDFDEEDDLDEDSLDDLYDEDDHDEDDHDDESW